MSGYPTATPGYNGAPHGTLVKAGGGLAIAACTIGLLVFLGGCLGYYASFKFGFLPALMGLVGLVLTIVGGVRKETSVENTHVLAAIFLSLWGIIGGLVLMAVGYHWHIFAPAGGM